MGGCSRYKICCALRAATCRFEKATMESMCRVSKRYYNKIIISLLQR